MSKYAKGFSTGVLSAMERVETAIRQDIARVLGGKGAIVAQAPAGAGKSQLIARLVGELRQKKAVVAVACPTNEQAYSLVERIATLNPRLPVCFTPATGRELPAHIARLPTVTQLKARDAQAAPLVVATMNKFADSVERYGTRYDALLIDEAYQADSARYFAVAGMADTHLLVGDSGQLDPFTTLDDGTYWKGGPEDPLQTAVGVLVRNHPSTPQHQLPVTFRLDTRAVPLARCFYPTHQFEAAVLPGTRQAVVRTAGGGKRDVVLDEAVRQAFASGWAYLVQKSAPLIAADPTTVDRIVRLVRRIDALEVKLSCEQSSEPRPLAREDIAVVVSHNDQKDALRAAFEQHSITGVTIETANKVQGLTFQCVIAWHPLSGSMHADAFHLDPGRLCVMLSRHRHACIVVGNTCDRLLLDGIPPATPGYLGDQQSDAVLDGWKAHEQVLDQLGMHAVPI
jgi:hypothetical protein